MQAKCQSGKAISEPLDWQFGQPRIVTTDKLRSYINPTKALAPHLKHRAHKGFNNAIDFSNRPTRRREKIAARFESSRHAQRFLSAYGQIDLIFCSRRHLPPSQS